MGVSFGLAGSAKSVLTRLTLISGVTLLAGCASFDGQPQAVLRPTPLATSYLPQQALETYYSKGTPEQRRTFRDTVIGIYMTAADANFLEFRRLLSRESKGSNFALGSGFTALTTAATVASERTANILSAFASGLSGIQGRLSSEVYFERTIPALLSGMEADRTRVRADIVARMDENDQYSLTEAFMDLARYEAAGSLDNAIETLTTQAAELREQEEARFENVVGLGRIVAPAARIELRTLGNRIDALALTPARHGDLAKVASHLGVPTNIPAADQARQIMTRLRDMAADDPASLTGVVDAMRTQGVDLSQ